MRTAGQRKHRQGMTVLVVLAVLAVTIALSYSIMRTQVTSAQIQENLTSREDARQAALAGLDLAIKRMHQSTWSGVNTQFNGVLDTGVRYVVQYEVGDPDLDASDPDYSKYPFRVTVKSTGYTVDTDSSLVTSTYEAQAVVELVPRALSNDPSTWQTAQNYTVTQWEDSDVVIQTPVRVEGPVALQGPVKLCEDYPPTSRPWDGKIDEVAVYNRALSQSEIQAIGIGALFGKTALASEIMSGSPQHYWRLDEAFGATTVIDSVGSANGTFENGTQAGASGFQYSNTCAEFDGVNDHINVGNFNVSGDEITMLAYFKADSWDASPYARIISKATGTSNDDHYWMLSTAPSGSNYRIRSRIRTNGSTSWLVASSGNLLPNVWYMAAAVYDGTDMILYLNGVEVGRKSKTGNLNENSDVPVYIGESPPGSPQTRLLRDLQAKNVAGLDDWRPLAGPLSMPRSNTDDSTLVMLEDDLALTVNDTATNNTAPVTHPGSVSTYQLYTGGPSYSVEAISSGDQWTSLEADPETNPLGLFYVNGSLSLQDSVSVEGTIVTSGSNPDVSVRGDSVAIKAVSLPALYGTSDPVELPAIIAGDDVKIGDVTGGDIQGAVFAGDEFAMESGSQSASCAVSGMLVAGELQLEGRTEWSSVTSYEWESRLTAFVNQLLGGSPEPYFPDWLNDNYSLSSQPQLTIKPRSESVKYYWPDWSQPVFVPHADDDGLLWKVIRTSETP